MRCYRKSNQKGFTLLEIIITLIIAGIMGAMLFQYFGTALTQSSVPVERLKDACSLQEVLEKINADYKNQGAGWSPWSASTPYNIDNIVLPTSANGHYYTCKQAGTSGTEEPEWPTSTGATVNDGGVRWQETPFLGALNTKIGSVDQNNKKNNAYGQYYVDFNGYIKFVEDEDTGIWQESTTNPGNDILKVIIRNDLGETLTALFVRH